MKVFSQAKVNEDLAKSAPSAWKCSIANLKFNTVAAVKKVKAKTLIIFGEKDMLRSKEKAFHNAMKGSKLVIIPDAGHLPQLDNPEAFMKAVQPFLK